MSEFSWSSKQQKQAIADRFFQGDLSPANDNLIPCDHTSSLFLLPVMVVAFVLPLPMLVIGFGVNIIRNPASLRTVYQRFAHDHWQGQLLGVILLLFIAVLSTGLFIQGIAAVRSAIRGVKESRRERQTGQYRYGLLLTKHYFALRTMESPYEQQPFILGRREIAEFRLATERVEGHTTRYIVMVLYQPDGKTYTMQLPSGIQGSQPTLHSTLRAWLAKE